jgi:hypothetical protein
MIICMEKRIQVVAFEVPYPPNYGGIIDIFYKLKSLHYSGYAVTLHAFESHRGKHAELEKLCREIYYYPRKKSIWNFFSVLPYIVVSRSDKRLLANILINGGPVLFEGLHSCFLLSHSKLASCLKIVRTHNVEHNYYMNLFESAKSPARKLFFLSESLKLRIFQRKLKYAQALLCISPTDQAYFQGKFGNAHYIPGFHPFDEVSGRPGKGAYILYHGNLSVPENEEMVFYLLRHVFVQVQAPVVIAGLGPTERLRNEIGQHPGVRLVANPGETEMSHIIASAHICVIPAFKSAGFKLKLLYTLFKGRFCVVNQKVVEGTGLDKLCTVAAIDPDMPGLLNDLMQKDYPESILIERRNFLETHFSNNRSIGKMENIMENLIHG